MNPRAVALRGIGYGPLAVATRGFLLLQVGPPVIVAYERLEAQLEAGLCIRLAVAQFLDIELEAIAMIEETADGGAILAIPAASVPLFVMDSTIDVSVEIDAPIAASITLTAKVITEE